MKYIVPAVLFFVCIVSYAQPIRVGAKHFNEGYILSEIIAQLLETRGLDVERQYHLGGTLVCFEALNRGEIDIYPEYTGTIAAEILRTDFTLSASELNTLLFDRHQLQMSSSFGFSNTYALVMSRTVANEQSIKSISDLAKHESLKPGISYEFLKRIDGWEKLASTYQLPQTAVGMEHGLAYQALDEKSIDFTDAYSTDGEIATRDLLLLEDDQSFFPDYQAVALYRTSVNPAVVDALKVLSKSITESEMQKMNAEALSGKSFEKIAAEFLQKNGIGKTASTSRSGTDDLLAKTMRHLVLVLSSLLLAVIIAIPLGISLHRVQHVSNTVVYFTGLLQTIPSIALLAIMIPIFGIGMTPAIVALFLYAILPILRNTVAGLKGVDPLLTKMAAGIGMTPRQQLRLVELPLAAPVIIAGIRTAAVISVGTATLAAFIGAGGLGEYIVTGLALNNTSLILKGAIPAAALALLVELAFDLIERRLKRRTKT